MSDAFAPAPTRLADYAPPAWRVNHVALQFELSREVAEVEAALHLQRDVAAPLVLDGEALELLWLELDGARLADDAYSYDGTRLTIAAAPAQCVLRSRVRLRPSANTRLEGLYSSGRLLLTQCEAEGFRRITFFVDRPDVLATWITTLRAVRDEFPVLLAGGNPVGKKDLAGGRHETTWVLPHPTPCYLFAIAAGPMAAVSKTLTGADGRNVTLNVWREGDDASRCAYALGAVERSLRWDEAVYGRCYDLDVFNVVAADDFTMGAMENKGLNIFNARFIVADEATATDADFLGIESVVGHEYFHNWSGNRVTLRDWFQLSLKEGLTVFRDQEFSADLHSRALKRIEDVRLLRSRQFAEDAGGLAHPVRPAQYQEINNFYTATVYEKGAEIIRMLRTRVGAEIFRRGMDRYFARHDGQAATLEDFFTAHAEASGQPVQDMLAWYAQAGTPTLQVHTAFIDGCFEATIKHVPAAHVAGAAVLPLPLRFAAYDAHGNALPMPAHDALALADGLLWLTQGTHHLTWQGLSAAPLLVLNQGFAAPVQLRLHDDPQLLARIVAVEPDGFARWDALQALVGGLLRGEFMASATAEAALSDAIGVLLTTAGDDPALVAECMNFPDVDTLAVGLTDVDPARLFAQREALITRLAITHRRALRLAFDQFAAVAEAGLDDAAMAARQLRGVVLGWLSRAEGNGELAMTAYREARGMTARLAALRALVHAGHPAADVVLEAFAAEFLDNMLVTDKWLAVLATTPQADAVSRIGALLAGPWWKPTNPNRVRAVLGSFARSNPAAFHREDGAGYRLLAQQVAVLDAINPQVAARLLTAFESWRQWSPALRAYATAALEPLQVAAMSRDTRETLQRLLD